MSHFNEVAASVKHVKMFMNYWQTQNRVRPGERIRLTITARASVTCNILKEISPFFNIYISQPISLNSIQIKKKRYKEPSHPYHTISNSALNINPPMT